MTSEEFLEGTIAMIARGWIEVREVEGKVRFKVTDKGIAHAMTHAQQELEL